MTARKKNMPELDKVNLIASAIAGIVGCFVSGLIYKLISTDLWSPLAVGISFMIFTIIFIAIMCIVNLANGNLTEHAAKHHDGKKIGLALMIVIVLSLIFGTIFEGIYEIDFFGKDNGYLNPTSYVFIIDNSGSMESNDPEGMRYQAIDKIIDDKDDDFLYAVYSFNNGITQERALAPVSDGKNELTPVNRGQTEIRSTLESLFDDYKGYLKPQLGDAPKFLLLSDGYASDIGMFSSIDGVLRDYAKSNITISTVGLGDVDTELMQQIADDTGGVYINVNDIDQLEQSMQKAINESGDNKYARTFYTYRNVPSLDVLYGIMRVLFTAILSVFISASMLFATASGKDDKLILLTSLITGILAGLLLELCINLLYISPGVIRYLYYLLTALTFVTVKSIGGNGRGRQYTDKDTMDQTKLGRLDMGEISSIGSGNNTDRQTVTNSPTYRGSSDDFF